MVARITQYNFEDNFDKGPDCWVMSGKKNPMFGKRPSGLDSSKTCEYCGKVVNLINFGRWHGDRCKEKPL